MDRHGQNQARQDVYPDVVALFDRTAARSFDATDTLIRDGKYARGQAFLDAVATHVAPGGTILDYGCGRGRISRMIAARGYTVHATDPSAESLGDARKQDTSGLAISFSLLGERGGGLDTAAYDGVVCSSVVEFVEDSAALLRSFHRALKPGGALLISFANRQSLWRAYAKYRFGRSGQHFALQRHAWSTAEFHRLLTGTGFSSVRTEAFFEPPGVTGGRLSLFSCRFTGTLGLVSARREPR